MAEIWCVLIGAFNNASNYQICEGQKQNYQIRRFEPYQPLSDKCFPFSEVIFSFNKGMHNYKSTYDEKYMDTVSSKQEEIPGVEEVEEVVGQINEMKHKNHQGGYAA